MADKELKEGEASQKTDESSNKKTDEPSQKTDEHSNKKRKLEVDEPPAKRQRTESSTTTVTTQSAPKVINTLSSISSNETTTSVSPSVPITSSSSCCSQTQTCTQVIERPPETIEIVLKKKVAKPEPLKNTKLSTKISASMKSLFKTIAPEALISKDEQSETEKLCDNPDKLKEFEEKIRKRASKMREEANKRIEEAENKFIKELPGMTESEANEVVSWWDSVVQFFSDIWNTFSNLNAVKLSVTKINLYIDANQLCFNLMYRFIEAINTAIEKIKEGLKWVADKFKEAVKSLVDGLKALFS